MRKQEIEQMALRIKLLEEDSRKHDLKIREQGLAIHIHDGMFMQHKALLDEQMRKNVTVTISREDAEILIAGPRQEGQRFRDASNRELDAIRVALKEKR